MHKMIYEIQLHFKQTYNITKHNYIIEIEA